VLKTFPELVWSSVKNLVEIESQFNLFDAIFIIFLKCVLQQFLVTMAEWSKVPD